jgi:GAF domain-containing protein
MCCVSKSAAVSCQDRLHVYTYDALNDQYAALADGDGRPTSDIRFASNSPLVQYFQQENIPLYLDTIDPPAFLKGDEARLSLLGARLFVVLEGEERPVGWLALGNPMSGNVYTPKDLDFLKPLADQASVAISRVQTVADLERRVTGNERIDARFARRECDTDLRRLCWN